jgi:NhaA family Na+:H+ antiporter
VPAQKFIHTESSSGIVLLIAAAIALIWVNSPFGFSYEALWNAKVSFAAGPFTIAHTVREWVNDALMVLFFFVVGLEVKREFVHGELSDRRRASLPVAAALGGMLIPAALYAVVNLGTATQRGWGIPMATDIAFAVGVLALLGDRVPASMRVFLLALATVDDIGAILVIAVFYTEQISVTAVSLAVVLLVLMLAMRSFGVQNLLYFVPAALLFWLAVLESGVHATIAGVVLGLIAPTEPYLSKDTYADSAGPLVSEMRTAVANDDQHHADAVLGEIEELTENTEAPADRLVRLLHPWSSYFVLPLFALANAGVAMSSATLWQALNSPEARGIMLGLGLGKILGIVLFTWAAVRLKIATALRGVGWTQMAGVGLLAGIGFTVSLFITDLAFTNAQNLANSKASILAVSALAGIAGYVVLRVTGGSTAVRGSVPDLEKKSA